MADQPQPGTFSMSDLQNPQTPAAPTPTDPSQPKPAGTFSASELGGQSTPAVTVPHYTAPGVTQTMGPVHETIFDRVERMFRNANPNTRPNATPEDRAANQSGEMQLANPEDLMSPMEKQENPGATAIGEAAGGVTTPTNVLLALGLPGSGMLPKLAAAGFSAQMIYGAVQTYPEIKAAYKRGDLNEMERLLTHAAIDVGMIMFTAHHALSKTTAGVQIGDTMYEKALKDRIASPEARQGFANYDAKTQAIQNPHAPEPIRNIIRPRVANIAGKESLVSPLQEKPGFVTKVAANLATPEAAKEFQQSQAPAYAEQATHTVGQVFHDKIEAHNALVRGDSESPEKITGTATPAPYETFDDMYKAAKDSAGQTYAKADAEDAKDLDAWHRRVAEQQEEYKQSVERHNVNIREFNSHVAEGEEPMPLIQYNPNDAAVDEKPDTYSQKKTDLDAAKANGAPGVAEDIRHKAITEDIPKAQDSLDKWFKNHEEAIPNAEYQSAKRLRGEAEHAKDIAQALRQPIKDGKLTGNMMRQIESNINKKAVRRNVRGVDPENTFENLLGPEAYKNWNQVKGLFDPIKTGSGQSWGTRAVTYMAEGLVGHALGLGPRGIGAMVGATEASRWIMNRALFDPEFGSILGRVSDSIKSATGEIFSLPGDLRNQILDYVDRYKNSGSRGAAGAAIEQGNEPIINKPFGRAGLGGAGAFDDAQAKAAAETRQQAVNETPVTHNMITDAEGKPDRLEIMKGDQPLGHLKIEEQIPGTWTVKDAVVNDPGKGYGLGAYKQLIAEAQKAGINTIESDVSNTSKAAGLWQALQQEMPNAVTEENGQYSMAVPKEASVTHVTPVDPQDRAVNNVGKPSPEEMAKLDEQGMATRIPNTANADVTNNAVHSRGLDAINEADKLKPTKTMANGDIKLGYKATVADKLAEYPNSGVSLTAAERSNPNTVINKYLDHFTGNLKDLYKSVPKVIRDAAVNWYPTAHYMAKDMADRYGVSHPQAAAVIASLSPQNFWDNNAGLADRFIQHWSDAKDHMWDPQMDAATDRVRDVQTKKIAKDEGKGKVASVVFRDILDNIRGKGYKDLEGFAKEQGMDTNGLRRLQSQWLRMYDEAHGSARTPLYSPDGSLRGTTARTHVTYDMEAKAIEILETGKDNLQHIHEVMGDGQKIRNFYNNIMNPWSKEGHVTIDTHAVGAAWGKPVSGADKTVMDNFGGAPGNGETGLKGMYSVYEEAYTRAAKELGIAPRELQSVTWEAIRSLIEEQDKKSPEFRKDIDDIWKQVENKKIDRATGMKRVMERAGGYKKPDWVRPEDWGQENPDGSLKE